VTQAAISSIEDNDQPDPRNARRSAFSKTHCAVVHETSLLLSRQQHVGTAPPKAKAQAAGTSTKNTVGSITALLRGVSDRHLVNKRIPRAIG
jgi:hypothetical protein